MNLQKSLKTAAIGVTLVFAPALPFFFLVGAEEIGLAIVLCLVQFAGAMIWNSGLSKVISWARERKIVLPGIRTTQGGVVCLSISLIFMILSLGLYSSYYYNVFDSAYAGFCVLVFQASMIVLWCGLARLNKFFQPLEVAKIGVILATFFLIVTGIFVEMPGNIGAFGIILYILGIVAAELVGWWRAVGYASIAEQKAAEISQPQPVVSVTAAPDPVEPPPFVSNQQPAAPSRPDDKTLAYLMSLDDDTLRSIAAKGDAQYSFGASLVLELRQAWEQIKDYSDERLDEMLTSQAGMYTDAVLDAASMELYQRRSPLLIDKINNLPMSEIREMAKGDNGYYDGYVRAARDIVYPRTQK